jgi:4-amino-4-deoxy-L-arabinose transferase-like glycosyltransferase
VGLFNRWSLNVIFVFACIIYIFGLTIDVIEIDSAQYASNSGEMYRTGSYLEVYQNGVDYLDKPPLIFWTASWMYEIFGVHNWSFKLSSLLFSILGIMATYKIGYLLYNKRIGFVAALILLTCQAYFIYNNDVRTDAQLTGAVSFAVWQLIAYLYTKKWLNLVLGFIAIGVAMLAKGPIGIMVPALAMGSYLIGKQQYKKLFNWHWLVGLGVTALVLLPMSIGLYTQFDAQPEKEVIFPTAKGPVIRDHVSGLKFFYWDQSFGRITGENSDWSDNSGFDFFFGIFAYSFMPWSLIAYWAIVWRIFNAARDFALKRKKQEWLTLGGFVLPFIAFSLSKFKLDHYIYVTYPFAAIITAEFILRVIEEKPKWWVNTLVAMQSLAIIVAVTFAYILASWVFPTSNIFIWSGLIILSILTFYFLIVDSDKLHKIILASVFAALTFNWVFNLHFYNHLSSEYQNGKKLVTYIEEESIPKDELLISTMSYVYQINFYAKSNFWVHPIEDLESMDLNGKWVFVKDDELETLMKKNPSLEIVKSFTKYPITRLSTTFLNPNTRAGLLTTNYLVYIK